MKKVFFAIAMLAASIFSASADVVTFSLGDPQTVTKGDIVEIIIAANATDFTMDAYSITVDIEGGLEYATVLDEDDEEMLAVTSKRSSLGIITSLAANGTTLGVIGYMSNSNAPFTGEKSIVSVKIDTKNAAAGTHNVTISNASVAKRVVGEDGKVSKTTVFAEGTFSTTITVEEPTYYLAGDAAILPATGDDLIITTEEPKVFSAVDHLLAGNYNYSVTIGNEEGAETLATGTPLVIESNGKYDITYTLTQADGTYSITAVATRVDNATAIDELDAATAEKLLIDGQVIIRRNGIDYTVTGQKL